MHWVWVDDKKEPWIDSCKNHDHDWILEIVAVLMKEVPLKAHAALLLFSVGKRNKYIFIKLQRHLVFSDYTNFNLKENAFKPHSFLNELWEIIQLDCRDSYQPEKGGMNQNIQSRRVTFNWPVFLISPLKKSRIYLLGGKLSAVRRLGRVYLWSRIR